MNESNDCKLIESCIEDMGLTNDWRRLVEYNDEHSDGNFQNWLTSLSENRKSEVLKLLKAADETGKMPTSKAYLEWLNE